MKYGVWIVLFASLVVAAVVYTAGDSGDRCLTTTAQAAEKTSEKPGGPPPLVVDRGAPLLLEEPPEKDPLDVPIGPVADNLACYCCHINYEEETFVVQHAKADVGCVECHGDSLDHRNDEDNITPPDVMFPPEKIAANCAECHKEHDAPAVDVIVRWQERCPAITDPKTILCTDCHGEHRLKLRTIRWNKKTGELIVRDQQQPIKMSADPTKKTPKNGSDEVPDTDSAVR